MSKKIITISREFGSGGRFIGENVAKELGYKYYDKDLIAEIAKKSGFAESFVEDSAELSSRKGFFAYAFLGRDAAGFSLEDQLFIAQRKVILEVAKQEPCVIIGRNADYILGDREDVLNVFITGDMPEKVKRIKELYNVDEKEAKKLIKDIDKRRATNYNYYTERKWGQASNYSLCLDSSVFGYEECCRIIVNAAKNL